MRGARVVMPHTKEEEFSPEFLPPRPVCGERIEVRGKRRFLLGQEFRALIRCCNRGCKIESTNRRGSRELAPPFLTGLWKGKVNEGELSYAWRADLCDA
jgi:hypothetical protein